MRFFGDGLFSVQSLMHCTPSYLHSVLVPISLYLSPPHQRKVVDTFLHYSLTCCTIKFPAPTLSSSFTTTRIAGYNSDCSSRFVNSRCIESFFKKRHDLPRQTDIDALRPAANIRPSVSHRLAVNHLEQLYRTMVHCGFCSISWLRRYILPS